MSMIWRILQILSGGRYLRIVISVISVKLLVIGISGLTGYKVASLASSVLSVHGTYNYRRVNLDHVITHPLDVTNFESVDRLVSDLRPDIIVNTSALHNVDYCETHPDENFRVNSHAVRNLAEISRKLGAKLIHISTDYVFDGTASYYHEEDITNPLNSYGKAKLEGEKAVSEISDFAILRPSIVYGWTPLESLGANSSSGKPINFVLWAITKMARGEKLRIVTDQHGSPTLADSLAKAILYIIDKNLAGIFHISGLTCMSRFDLTKKIAQTFGYPESLISPVLSAEFKQIAPRPSETCLDCSKALHKGIELMTVNESLRIMYDQIKKYCPELIGEKRQ